jgi:hypothetical protein
MSDKEQELKIDIEAVKAMVAAGKDRKEIAKELGITLKECREVVFQNEELKGIRKPQSRKQKRKIVLVKGEAEVATATNTTSNSNEAEEEEEQEETANAVEETPATEEKKAGEKPSKVQW